MANLKWIKQTNKSGTRKLKCTGEQPSCSRCMTENIACVYSAQKTMGRPRKRKIQETDATQNFSNNEPSQTTRRQTSSTEPIMVDSGMLAQDSATNQLTNPDMDLFSLGAIDGFDLPTSSDLNDSSENTCACLSSLYITLDNLRSMESFDFASGLYRLRNALSTADSCIDCQVCPARFLTATQNAQLLGTLLLNVSERYNTVLKTINSEARQAEEMEQLKVFHIGGVGVSESENPHIRSIAGPSEPLVLEVPPLEWRRLAKKVVMAEVYGTSDTSRTSFMSVLTTLEQRQDLWHKQEPTEDCPNPDRRRRQMHHGDEAPMCLVLAREARKLVDLFDFT